jgi:hypothetical protein
MTKSIIAAFTLFSLLAVPANAYHSNQASAGASGAQARHTARSGGSLGWTSPTGAQYVQLPRTSSGGLAGVYGGASGLPPTRLDSFVKEAGGLAEYIYGDEGTNAPPPIKNFLPQNRIDFGITASASNAGLTTGHESLLPTAWGSDEFSPFPEQPTVSGDHVIRDGNGQPAGYPLDPMSALPGGTLGGGSYDASGAEFPGASGR